MHSNDLEPAIQDEESFRTAVTDFLKENCEQIGDSESTLEDDPDLGKPPDIFTFASNGHTSEKMLRETYLLAIDREKVAIKTQKKIKPSSYSMIKRASLDLD